MNTQSLPGIFKIGFLECEKLSPQLALKSMADLPVAILTDVVNVIFYGTPTCDAISDGDNNGRSEKTTLKFLTSQTIPTDTHIAFVIQCINGQNYIIGAKEAPFPIVKIETSTGSIDGNPSVFSVEVTHMALKSLLSVAV